MKTVLIVEDDPANLFVFSKMVSKRGGLAVKHTEDVAEVLTMAGTGAADIILMDIILPHSEYQGKIVSGLEISKMLKANPQTAKVPVILVSSEGTVNDAKRYLDESGADGYFAKPIVDWPQFIAQLNSLLPA
ncbi:response regulator [[Phormidium] sp. ETS-05]|uniref:response regulator n=1 Tax=[Phormidium] sp. ETS-05 TaxID=222819 RepID=UPI0018EF34C7|nr:response regulator [[Phormidium] sp. ETS-05]